MYFAKTATRPAEFHPRILSNSLTALPLVPCFPLFVVLIVAEDKRNIRCLLLGYRHFPTLCP